MSKNGWIACSTVVIVLLCVGIFCLIISLLVIAAYTKISPTFSWNLPFETGQLITPTTTPVVVRPFHPDLQPSTAAPPVSTPLGSGAPSSTPEAQVTPALVPTDTLHALESSSIPINDPLELAHRLLNLENLSPTLASPLIPVEIGTHQAFWVGNGEVTDFRVQATLRYVTDHAYFWIEDGVRYNANDLRKLADTFESQIYPTEQAFFGSEWTPGVDGDPHIYIVYARGLGEQIAGYYSSADEYPLQVNRHSNMHEMFLFNADNSPLDDTYTYGVLAHELQHMIHWRQDRNESNWLGEGFSELATLLNHYYSGGFDALYTSNPDLQLNNWPDDTQEDTSPHYGASFLFVTYFLDRFGEAVTKALVANQDNDLKGVDSTLAQSNTTDPLTGNRITADDFFLDWAITNYLMDPEVGDGRYSYTTYKDTPPAGPTQTIRRCPTSQITSTVHQYGVDYIRFTCPGASTIHFEGSIQTALLPQDPYSGRFAMWSNKSDESDTTLTQTFDLTDYQGALSLNYWTWYDLENGYDFVYLEASTDGQTWHILPAPSGTSADPKATSYGWGYTGSSGGEAHPAWIKEKVDLSSFAGEKLTLRFEYITDSNVTGEGFMLDNLSIPEIGYSTDFESGLSGWQAAGWVRIANVLPQPYRLALISKGATTQVQYLNLNPDISLDIPFTIGNGVDEVIFVVSATNRFTRQQAPYQFRVSQP